MYDPTSYASYVRDIEAHLCRKNDGHLIRIVGPAFEQVSGWARQGVPVKVACSGIDRYFERYYRKGPRRRPVRIEFCEADVLDAFDDWRRAVGVTASVAATEPASGGDEQGDAEAARRRGSLAAHVERSIAVLTALRASGQHAHVFSETLDHVCRELDLVQPVAKRARGAAREAALSQLAALDQKLLTAVMESADEAVRTGAQAEARQALAPFRDRMTPDAYQRACAAAVERHIRLHFGLPTIAFDR
jgi:hypothetical protein